MRSKVLIGVLLLAATTGAAAEVDVSLAIPFDSPDDMTARTPIDALVLTQLHRLEIEPAKVCSDAVFLRRVYLDLIGTLPTAEEAREFLADRNPNKRRALINRLFERDEFADYWALKWGDLLRVKAEFPINLWPNAVHAYHRWIRTAVKENMPYDQFARELLTSSGSNFRMPQVNFYRAMQSNEPEMIARMVTLTFMGERAEIWDKQRLAGMASFFSRVGYKNTGEWKEEIVFFDAMKAVDRGAPTVFPDGTPANVAPGVDPRRVFADWLIAPENPWFTRTIVNRAWYWFMGRGIIHEPDDLRPDNPPANPELLALLEKELVTSQYDLRYIFQLILNSQTYQLSCVPRTAHAEGAKHFAYYPLRLLDAEVLIDALNQITGTAEEYSSPVPEPFTFIPADQRSIALSDGSITSSFLEMFGRPPRDTGLESERTTVPSAAQRLHLLNSSHIRNKIENSQNLRSMALGKRQPLAVVNDLYLTVLSRFPTERELEVLREHANEASGRDMLVDVTWALINSPEFLLRH